MDASPLLDLPPELIVHVLSYLPVKSLLRFSQTCHTSHSLATSSLQTLSLAIHATRLSGIMSRLGATALPTPKKTTSAFAFAPYPRSISYADANPRSSRSSQSSILTIAEDSIFHSDPHAVNVFIPDANAFDPSTLLAFHTALMSSILTRHKPTLRHLDISLWALTPSVAHTLISLRALRTLSLRIEDPHARSKPRKLRAAQRIDECLAWEILADDPSWATSLQALRIDGAQISTPQLKKILASNRLCRELWICKCQTVDRNVWKWLGTEWQGRTRLQILGVLRCYVEIEEEDLDFITGLEALQFLALQGFHGVDSHVVEEMNEDVWRIPEFLGPHPSSRTSPPGFIEVDPAYQGGNNHE